MGRDQKAQLGARVRPDAREIAVARAEAEGMSLNEYVERLIRADGGNHVLPPGDPPEQTTIEREVLGAVLAPPVGIKKAEIDTRDPADLKRFAPNCVNATYHWNNNPDNPCRSCGGVI